MAFSASKLAASAFIFVSLISVPASAHISNKVTTPAQICAHLMEHFTGGVMISRFGVGFSPRHITRPHRQVSAEMAPYYNLMVRLPFGDDILRDFSRFSKLSWNKWDEGISTIGKTRSGRTLDISISSLGFMDVKLGSSSMIMEDRAYLEKVVALLRKENVEAMLYAGLAVLPFDPEDGLGLWISRLDLNNVSTRAGLVKLFAYLDDN